MNAVQRAQRELLNAARRGLDVRVVETYRTEWQAVESLVERGLLEVAGATDVSGAWELRVVVSGSEERGGGEHTSRDVVPGRANGVAYRETAARDVRRTAPGRDGPGIASEARRAFTSLERGRHLYRRWSETARADASVPWWLWSIAVRVARTYGLHRTACELGLDYRALRRRLWNEEIRRREVRERECSGRVVPFEVAALTRGRDREEG